MCVCERETSSAFVITLTQVQVQSTKLCVCLVHGKKSPMFCRLVSACGRRFCCHLSSSRRHREKSSLS